MAIIENKVHAFWVLPKDGDEYRQLGVVVGPHPEMDQEFIFYSKRKSSTGTCAVRKDAIKGFELIALDEENPK